VNEVAFITAHDRGRADSALVRRFRQAQTKRERTAVFAEVVHQHRDAVLGWCADRLWPDADAAVAAAGDVLIVAALAMADPAKLARPERLRSWLLGIAHYALTSGLPERLDDIAWDAVQARVTADVPEMWVSPASRESLRHWLEQIVRTLPEPRQRLYDLCVARGLDSRNAALQLGTTVAELQRLRRDNRQAIIRAFEVTVLAAAGPRDSEARGCWELRQILSEAPHDADPHAAGRRPIMVLPAALRLTVTRHLSQCRTCQDRCDDGMARWAPQLLSVLAEAELNEQVMEDLNPVQEVTRTQPAIGAHRRVTRGGTVRRVVARPAAMVAGAGLLVALLVLGFVWPGFLHGSAASAQQGSAALSAQDPSSGNPAGSGAAQATGTTDGASGRSTGQPTGTAAAAPSASPAPGATGSLAAPSPYGSTTPPVQYTSLPSTSTTTPTSSSAKPTSAPSAVSSASSVASSSPAASPSPSASQPSQVATTPPASPDPSTAPASTTPPSTPATTPAPSDSATAAPSAVPSDSSTVAPSAVPSDSSTAAPSAAAAATPSAS